MSGSLFKANAASNDCFECLLAEYFANMGLDVMGKKKREEMAKHEKKFIDGSVANNIPRAKAEEIFNLMSQFADYGFNRSHSMAYAYVAFQTAYLKAHYPSYFFSAVLSHEADDSAKVYKYSSELRAGGLQLLPPDVNESDDGFTPTENAVRFGLSAIKGIGAATINGIVKARNGRSGSGRRRDRRGTDRAHSTCFLVHASQTRQPNRQATV